MNMGITGTNMPTSPLERSLFTDIDDKARTSLLGKIAELAKHDPQGLKDFVDTQMTKQYTVTQLMERYKKLKLRTQLRGKTDHYKYGLGMSKLFANIGVA